MSQTPKISRQSLVRDYFRKIRMFSRNARLFLLATVLNGFAMGIWTVLFNLYLLDLRFREDFIGYMLLLGGLAAGLAAFPAGIICGKVGRKKTLLTGVAVGSIFNNTVQNTLEKVPLFQSLKKSEWYVESSKLNKPILIQGIEKTVKGA